MVRREKRGHSFRAITPGRMPPCRGTVSMNENVGLIRSGIGCQESFGRFLPDGSGLAFRMKVLQDQRRRCREAPDLETTLHTLAWPESSKSSPAGNQDLWRVFAEFAEKGGVQGGTVGGRKIWRPTDANGRCWKLLGADGPSWTLAMASPPDLLENRWVSFRGVKLINFPLPPIGKLILSQSKGTTGHSRTTLQILEK